MHNSVLIIGVGRFGRYLALKFSELGNDVMIVDRDEDTISKLMSEVTSAKIADCTREEALQGIGVKNFDVCFVCTGSDFQASLEITSRLSEMGAKKIISKASTDIHAKFLLRNGADEVVYPERDRAVELAVKYSDTRILDFAQMDDDIGIYEVSSADSWWGKTISSLGIRTKYKLNILAVKRDHKTIALPEPSFEIQKGDALIVMAEKTSLDKYLKSVKTR